MLHLLEAVHHVFGNKVFDFSPSYFVDELFRRLQNLDRVTSDTQIHRWIKISLGELFTLIGDTEIFVIYVKIYGTFLGVESEADDIARTEDLVVADLNFLAINIVIQSLTLCGILRVILAGSKIYTLLVHKIAFIDLSFAELLGETKVLELVLVLVNKFDLKSDIELRGFIFGVSHGLVSLDRAPLRIRVHNDGFVRR